MNVGISRTEMKISNLLQLFLPLPHPLVSSIFDPSTLKELWRHLWVAPYVGAKIEKITKYLSRWT